MKTFAEQINEVKNTKVSNEEKMNMLIKLGCTKNECYAIFYNWGKQDAKETFSHVFAFTFGVEMETYNCQEDNLKAIARGKGLAMHGTTHCGGYNHTDSQTSFKVVSDSSIQGNDTLECVSPVLNEQGFDALERMCVSLGEAGAKVNKSCGLHVHIGAKDLNDAQYVNVFNNYKMLEGVIDTFMAESRRGNNSRWCHTLADHDFEGCRTRRDVQRELDFDRYHKVNAEAWSRHMTIEFRQMQGSINYTKISNWVRFCAKLVEFSKTNRLTSEVTSVDAIPFLTQEEKGYFNRRAQELA